MKEPCVYLMASSSHGTFYTGVTSNLIGRISQHRDGVADSFTRKHGCKLLVWFEAHDDLQDARLRELQIKKWKRQWKLRLIEEMNPAWDDLFPALA